MSKNLLRCLTLVATGVVAINIILSGCKGNSKEQEKPTPTCSAMVPSKTTTSPCWLSAWRRNQFKI